MIGVSNSNYKTGKSYAKWFNEMKPLIMERDAKQCSVCLVAEQLKHHKWKDGRIILGSNLLIHHIDHNPGNNIDLNLIVLCQTCHQKHHHCSQTPFPQLKFIAQNRSTSMTSKWKEQTISLQTKYLSIIAP